MTGNKSTIGMGSIAVLIVSLYLFCLSLSKEEPIIRKKLNKTRVKWIHFDVMDGHYVPNITIGSSELDALSRKSKIPIDIHFMVSNPDEIVPHFVKKYKNMNIVNITVHCETCKNIKKLSRLVRKANISFGLAIHPNTSISKISRFFDYIDLALVMTVKPGFAGQKIIPSCIRKVKELSELNNQKNSNLDEFDLRNIFPELFEAVFRNPGGRGGRGWCTMCLQMRNSAGRPRGY